MVSNCYAAKRIALSMTLLFGYWPASSWGALPESDAQTAQVGGDVIDEVQQFVNSFIVLKQDYSELVSAELELKQDYAELESAELELKDANHTLTSNNSELLLKIETLQSELKVLKAKPVCTWTVLAESITGSSRSQLDEVCGHSLDYEDGPVSGEPHIQDGVPLERPLAPADPALALSLSDVALALQRTGQYQEAEVYFSWALMILQSESKENHLPTAAALNNLSDLYLDMEEYIKAEHSYRSTLTEYRYVFDDAHPKIAAIQNKLAASLRGQGRFIKAEDLYRKSIEKYGAALGGEHPHLVAPLHNMAKLYMEMSRYDEAAACLNRAMSIVDGSESAAPYRDYIKTSMQRLAVCRASAGNAQEMVFREP
jgi:tetratricopeptide (TPR) repeat protein